MRSLDLLHKYASTFREMINSKLHGSKRSIRESLGLHVDTDWNFLTAGMDIVEDACEAIGNVQRFGLSGPTKYGDDGEKYLRLYGLLSAAYIQQRSLLTIYKLMHAPDLRQTKQAFNNSQLVILRHKLSAHGTDYRESGDLHAYVPVRVSLADTSVTVARHATAMDQETIDLDDAIATHITLMIEALDRMCEKTIQILFKEHPKKHQQFTEALSDLRIEKDRQAVAFSPGGDGVRRSPEC